MINYLKNILNKLNKNSTIEWPIPRYKENEQPHFLFLLTPPYSGSTAIAKMLSSSEKIMTLCENGEGQCLIPKLRDDERWHSEKYINYESIKAVWLNKYQQIKKKAPEINVVVEKSPPNMMRIKKLSEQFNDFSFIANNRNPYANCSSILYRKHKPNEMNIEQREQTIKKLANDWLKRSYIIKELIIELNIPLLTYEAFCEKPESIIDILNLPDGVSETINAEANVKVKDYKPQPIINQNGRQISNLLPNEIAILSEILSPHKNLMSFFNYQIINN